MKFFLQLKALFNKNISILPFQREDMVAFVKLRNNAIKINSHVEVEDNYNLVLVYYNKVCDVLTSGNYKLNEETIPKLYRFSKTPFGLKALTTRSIDCDVYYINLKKFTNCKFKTIDRVNALSEGQKVKVKLDGTFTMRVIDTLKFMKALCNDYAVIRNKKTVKEICSTVGFEVSKALNSKNFSVDDYLFNKDKIIATMEELVNNHTNTFGIEVSNFKIGEVIVNRKHLNEVQISALEKENNIEKEKEEISKIVEEGVDLEKDSQVIYVGRGEREQKEVESSSSSESTQNSSENKSDAVPDKESIDKIKIGKTLQKQIEESANKILENTNFKKEEKPEDIIVKDNFKTTSSQNNNISVNTNTYIPPKTNNPYGKGSKDYYKQPEPKILWQDDEDINDNEEPAILETNKQEIDINSQRRIMQQETKNENVEQETVDIEKQKPKKICSVCGAVVLEDNAKFCEKCGNKLNNYKTCACCGAKNFVDASECCVCKSVLD